MLRGVSRRISTLERSIPLAMTAELFWAHAEKYARRNGTSCEAATEALAAALSDDELDRLTSEFEQIAFGSDIAAREAAKCQALAGGRLNA